MTSGDVFPEVARSDLEATYRQIIQQLLLDKMELAVVRLGGVLGPLKQMLDGDAGVGVTFGTYPGNQRDLGSARFAEAMLLACCDRGNVRYQSIRR